MSARTRLASLRPVRTRLRTLLAPAVLAAGLAIAGCGGEGGTSCSGTVCTVQSDGPGTYELDQLGTEVEVSDLRAASVHVRINSEQRTVRADAAPVRLRGYLVSAPETGADRVTVRIER